MAPFAASCLNGLAKRAAGASQATTAQSQSQSGLGTLDLLLPLPYRVAIILAAGVWGWGLNLHYLSAVKIDVAALIRYPLRSRSSSAHIPLYRSTYQLASLLTIPLIVSLFFFWIITHLDARLVLQWEILPQMSLLGFFIMLLLPLHRLSCTGRARLLQTLIRISLGGLAETSEGKFGDIILADALTSYARIIGDLYVSTCMFYSAARANYSADGSGSASMALSSTGLPNRACGGSVLYPLVMAIPSIIRLRQCLIEFVRARFRPHASSSPSRTSPSLLSASNSPSATSSPGSPSHVRGCGLCGGQHLANALKYASAFPPIILASMQRNYNPQTSSMSISSIFRLWVLSSFINSLYTFYWDVAKDWDLTLFSAFSFASSSPSSRYLHHDYHPFGLRRQRFLHSDKMYYAAIIFDFVLRFTWVTRLSSTLDAINMAEAGIFTLQTLEVVRRWVWIFFRVETEWVRTIQAPDTEDILLGDISSSIKRDQE